VEHGQWRLAPAFDINPFPDKDPEIKLWLTGDSGPVGSIMDVMRAASYFWLSEADAKRVLAEVCTAILNWKAIAKSAPVGMSNDDLGAFVPALENEQMRVAMNVPLSISCPRNQAQAVRR
jgi:serine/threonine-protein kinase HipA